MKPPRKWLLLPLTLACAAAPQDNTVVRFNVIPQEIIQQRLEMVARKPVEREATLKSLFETAGCSGERLAEQNVPGTKQHNLICTLIGSTPEEIIVGGHVDDVDIGMGAVDDWSGASLLPSLYQSLESKVRKHRFVFVGFTAEEKGLRGSQEYVYRMPKEEKTNVRAMVNLECLGLTPPKVWARRADPRLLNAYAIVANALKLEPRAVNVDGVGDDDSHPFLNARMPVITIHSVTNETFRILHSTHDNVKAIQPADYYTAYRLAATYLAYLDTFLD